MRTLNALLLTVSAVSEIRTFFRHCPSCGRRFEIRLVGKEQVEAAEHSEDQSRLKGVPRSSMSTVWSYGPRPVVLEETAPVTVDLEEFQYTYRCKHCGHQWQEFHEKTEVEHKPGSYTGD